MFILRNVNKLSSCSARVRERDRERLDKPIFLFEVEKKF